MLTQKVYVTRALYFPDLLNTENLKNVVFIEGIPIEAYRLHRLKEIEKNELQ